MGELVTFLTVLCILFVVFRLLEFTRARERRLPVLRQGIRTDLIYLLFTPFVTKAITRTAVVLAIIPISMFAYGKFDVEAIRGGFGPMSRLPVWLQVLAMLTIGDFIGYWMHRWFHGRAMWRFHSIHHSSTNLDWISSVRLHPVNDALMKLASTVPLVGFGFAPDALTAVIPILTLMAILVHANLDWDWGMFRSIIVSPRFHRWHHTDESAARDKNFAGLFPIWDILFATYHMPREKLPTVFGTQTPVPRGFFGQLIFPFRKQG